MEQETAAQSPRNLATIRSRWRAAACLDHLIHRRRKSLVETPPFAGREREGVHGAREAIENLRTARSPEIFADHGRDAREPVALGQREQSPQHGVKRRFLETQREVRLCQAIEAKHAALAAPLGAFGEE